ncbi:hypothetical protein [Streptacidiphilus cavernicola]|uniref:Serine protease n=1 Tax=Streptacidiphilus cavernicola TaxID=3342716 RepID=A0ABV6VQA4_9ACTN
MPPWQDDSSVDRPIREARVAVYRDDVVDSFGGGVLLPGGLVVTCAHVLNLALGRDKFCHPAPVDQGAEIPGIHLLAALDPAAACRRVRLRRWVPAESAPGTAPRPDTQQDWQGDLALLELVTRPADPSRAPGWGHAMRDDRIFAWYARDQIRPVESAVRAVAESWITLAQPPVGVRFGEGLSGSALWHPDRQEILGLVVSTQGPYAFAIPTRKVLERLGDAIPGLVGLTTADPELLDLVKQVLTGPRQVADCARWLALQLPPPMAPPPGVTAEWLVGHSQPWGDRGVFTLLKAMEAHAALEEQRMTVREAILERCPDLVLTVVEHRELAELLLRAAPGLALAPQELVRLAHPLGREQLGAPADLAAAARCVEPYAHGVNQVPAVLRLVEHAAARTDRPGVGNLLRLWSSRVAQRIGVEQALRSIREDAREACRSAAQQIRLQVELIKADEGYRWVVQLRDRTGALRVLRREHTPRDLQQIAAELALIIDQQQAAPGPDLMIAFLVEPEQLGLEPEWWELMPYPQVRKGMGTLHPVLLRRPRAWRRRPVDRQRWDRLDQAPPLHLDGADGPTDPGELFDRLADDPGTGCIAVALEQTLALALVCVAAGEGVPAVLWLRAAEGDGLAAPLHDFLHGCGPESLRTLPEQVRLERRSSAPRNGLPPRLGHRLALIWEDPEWPFPDPDLTAPLPLEG